MNSFKSYFLYSLFITAEDCDCAIIVFLQLHRGYIYLFIYLSDANQI